ncbi:MAG TPA: PD-(D/E)XK nuclease family protein [Candidatus Paceibacterota bacterium]|nr:PD-(D/E)XK nuclease family protein [Candidatus Paceibacterota bacterium]
MTDKYTAVWVSHSSMGDFLKCPRLYYLHNMYKDPSTGRKISIVTPHLSLGVAVHEVLEGLGAYPAEERLQCDLDAEYERAWTGVAGVGGGFLDEGEEKLFKARGHTMLETVKRNPRFLINKRIKLPRGEMNPNFYLNEDENIILNGLIDWIEYLPANDSLHIVDFKTGKYEEKETSLQLPIYLLLCNALQKRRVAKASYWYLESDKIIEKELPEATDAYREVLEIALKIKAARLRKLFECPQGSGGCVQCRSYELILSKDPRARYVGIGGFKQDMYVVGK